MAELWQLTKSIRSKNAGPFELTFDIMFKDSEMLRARLEEPFAHSTNDWPIVRSARGGSTILRDQGNPDHQVFYP